MKLDERGSSTSLLIAFVLTLVLFFGAAGFGLWAYSSRQDYKTNVDQKIAAAVKVAQDQTATAKDQTFAEQEKQPLKTYDGPATYGSVVIKYPKTWSAYIVEIDQATTPIDGYFYPDVVPGLQSGTSYALRVQIVSDAYDQELKALSGLVQTGKVRLAAYALPMVPGTVGSRVDGQIMPGKQGSMVLFPLRDKTLKIWTETPDFIPDFNNNILPNASFSP